MFYTDDPIADFERYDRERAKYEASLPKCEYCGLPVEDDYYYEINGDILCEKCLNDHFRKDVTT